MNNGILGIALVAGTVMMGVHADAADFYFRYRGMGPTQVAAVEPPEEPEAPAEPESWLVFDFVGGIHAECETEVTAADFAPSQADFQSNGMLVWTPETPYGSPMSFGDGDLEGRMGFQSEGNGVPNGDGTVSLSITSDMTAGNGFGSTCKDGVFTLTASTSPSAWPEYSFLSDARIETR